MNKANTAEGVKRSDPPAVVRPRLVYHAKSAPVTVPQALTEHALRLGDYPVESVEIYRRDVVTKRVRVIPAKKPPVREEGVKITEYSDKAMRRGIFTAKNCDADFLSMITLTYPFEFPTDGKRVKRNFFDFCDDYRATFDSRCIWWLEFQRRGAPHFHVISEEDLSLHGPLLTVTRRKKIGRGETTFQTAAEPSNWLADRWYRIVGSKDPKHLKAGTAWEVIRAEEGAWVYMAAHGGKRKQKQVPDGYENVGGFWGKIGKFEIPLTGTAKVTTEDVFKIYGHAALSSKGKVKKYLYDAAKNFQPDEI